MTHEKNKHGQNGQMGKQAGQAENAGWNKAGEHQKGQTHGKAAYGVEKEAAHGTEKEAVHAAHKKNPSNLD